MEFFQREMFLAALILPFLYRVTEFLILVRVRFMTFSLFARKHYT